MDFTLKLQDDFPEQFHHQSKIRVLVEAMAKQLNDVYAFFNSLIADRILSTAVGAQLDGIGDIVKLTRAEAMGLSDGSREMDDELYRRYLAYKISVNTATCTVQDIYSAIAMFAKDVAVYKEDPEHPATITLILSDELEAMMRGFKFAKPAGVALEFDVFQTNNGNDFILKSFFNYLVEDNTELQWNAAEAAPYVYNETLYVGRNSYSVSQTTLNTPNNVSEEDGELSV